MKKSIGLLLVSPLPPPPGGVANWSVTVLAEAQRREFLEITHVNTAVRWRSTNDFLLHKRVLGGALQAVRDILRIYHAIKRSKPQVVHLCTSGSFATIKDIVILRLAKIFGIRSIVHFRMGRLQTIIAGNTLEWKFVRWAMLLADTVLLLDQKSEDSVKKELPFLPVQRIPNPIDLKMIQSIISAEEEKTSANKPYCIVYAGHVIPSKGIRELINACLLLGECAFELCLVGKAERDFQKELETLAFSKDGGRWLRFSGETERQQTLSSIHDADLFVLPSYTEGFPNVVIEAMSLSTPIVASRVGAVPEMLDENTDSPCGLLVAPQQVTELRDAILMMLNDPGKAWLYANRARQKANEFYSLEVVMDQYVRLWSSLASNKLDSRRPYSAHAERS